MKKWPSQLRKGDVLIDDNGNEFSIVKVQPVFGGSWYEVCVKGVDVPVPFGHSEKVEVK